MIKQGHIGAACAFRDLGFSPAQVKLAFLNRGLSDNDAERLVKEAWAGPLIGGAIRGIGSLLGRAAVGGSPKMLQAGQGILAQGGGRFATQAAAKAPSLMTNISRAPGAYGASTGSLTRGLVANKSGIANTLGQGLHGVGAAAQHSLSSLQQSPLKALGGGALNFGKGLFFMGSKSPSIANMAGKGYGMYGMGQMILGPGSTPMPSPQQY